MNVKRTKLKSSISENRPVLATNNHFLISDTEHHIQLNLTGSLNAIPEIPVMTRFFNCVGQAH